MFAETLSEGTWRGGPTPDGHSTQPTGPGGMDASPRPRSLWPVSLQAAGAERSRAEHRWGLALARGHGGHGITGMCQGSRRAAEDLGEAHVASTCCRPAGPGTWASSEQKRAASVGMEEIALLWVVFFLTVSFGDRRKGCRCKTPPLAR